MRLSRLKTSSEPRQASSDAAEPGDGNSHTGRTLLLTGSLTALLVAGISLAAAGAFSALPSRPPPATHTLKIRALAGTKRSATSSFHSSVDTVAPKIRISYPSNGHAIDSRAWGTSCPVQASICGTALDAHGVRSVVLSIHRVGGGWWGGGAFDQRSESFRAAKLASSKRDSTRWSYALRLPANGRYTVHVRATDGAGNTTAAAAQASVSFSVNTPPPPAPAITAEPEASTTASSASFAFTDGEHAVTLLCRRDGATFARCTSPESYSSLALGPHRFEVEAADQAGNLSAAAGYSWTVVNPVEASGEPFTVSGNSSGPLAPGISRSLTVTLSNPNNVAIEITALTVAVASASSNSGCDGPANLQLTQSNISAANPLAIPANGTASLPGGALDAPVVLMRDLPTNQDACKNASFTFTYSGSAHS